MTTKTQGLAWTICNVTEIGDSRLIQRPKDGAAEEQDCSSIRGFHPLTHLTEVMSKHTDIQLARSRTSNLDLNLFHKYLGFILDILWISSVQESGHKWAAKQGMALLCW